MSLKLIDRIAVVAILSTLIAIPVASHAADSPIYVQARKAAQGLNEDTILTIQRGMTSNEVLASLGSPEHKTRFEATKTTAWEYPLHDAWGYNAEFSVIMNDAGKVVSTANVRRGS